MIRLGTSYPAGEEVNLNVAVNNDAMIYDDSTTVTKYATETIAYAIFIQPARSIQADVNLSFILRMDFDMNYVFWVDTSNVFTAGLTAA